MVHYGKHIIDPKTGLCEICDRGAIHEIRRGKRAGRQFLYSNQDGKFTYRSADNDYNDHHEPYTKSAQKPSYGERAPTRNQSISYDKTFITKQNPPRHNYASHENLSQPQKARSRMGAYDEPLTSQRKPGKNDYVPPNNMYPSSSVRLATLYHVDNRGQMIPQYNDGFDDRSRRYVAQDNSPSRAQPSHMPPRRAQTPPRRAQTPPRRAQTPPRRVQPPPRRAQTPPPRAPPQHYESRQPQPRRQVNSDTKVVERQYQARNPDPYYNSPRKPEMYYVEGPRYNSRSTHGNVPTHSPHDNYDTSPRSNYPANSNGRLRPLEPIESNRRYNEPEAPVARKVYKKLPPNYDSHYNGNDRKENNSRPVRQPEKYYPQPKQYDSSPNMGNRRAGSPVNHHRASVYHIQSNNGY